VEERRFSAAIGFSSEWASAPVDGFAGTRETITGAKARIHFRPRTRPWKGRSSTLLLFRSSTGPALLLDHIRRWVFRQLLFVLVGALHFEFVEQD
jgi:hypothetical protein